MKPIRVMFNVESMEVAGAERVVLSMLKRLDRTRFEPVVCCLTERGELAAQVEALDIPVIALHKDPSNDLPVIPKLVKVIKEQKIDIVHTHSWPANVWGRVAGRLAGAPVVIATEHSVHIWKNRMHLILDKTLSLFTDKIICCSDAVEEFYLSKAGINKEKLTRIHNGIDIEPFKGVFDNAAARRALGIEADRQVVTSVGRLLPEKGHRYFLESLAQLRKDNPSILGIIAGEGQTRPELEALIDHLNLGGHARLLGERSDVPAILHMSDLFILPSSREGLPLSALEAMAAKKAVIVTDVGGNREAVVHEENGLVIPAQDSGACTAAIQRLLSSPEESKRMGEAGYRYVTERFSLDQMVRQNQELYQELFNSKQHRREVISEFAVS